jgi:hypothetical protein
MKNIEGGRPRNFLRAMADGRRFSLHELIEKIGNTNWKQGKAATWSLVTRGEIDVMQSGNGGQHAQYRISQRGIQSLIDADGPRVAKKFRELAGETLVQHACRTTPNSVFALGSI